MPAADHARSIVPRWTLYPGCPSLREAQQEPFIYSPGCQVQRKFEAPWLGAHGETRLWLMSLHPQWAATAAGGEVPQRGVACRVTEVLSHPAVMETCWDGSEPSPKVAKYSNHEAGKVGGTAGGDSVPGTRDTVKSGFHKVLLWWGLLPWRRNDKQSNRPSNGVCGSDSFEFLTDLYRMPRAHMLQTLTLCWTSGCVGRGLPISGTGLQQFRVNPGVLT
ncbi:uncharacterized protein [Alexandromys fortis]|uniref:uncharacterized protein n=1 Tax=Alexandromys fortis TaxID=100897 RepID=UPI0021524BB8|nr:uncharacterized protein LOC126508392 [Microtus fortis]